MSALIQNIISLFLVVFWSLLNIPVILVEFFVHRKCRLLGINLTKRQEKQALETLEAAFVEHKFFTASDGARIHYVERLQITGQSKGTVIFVHGFPSFWYSWKEQIEYFYAKGYDVVAPDMRGYGKSESPVAVSAYEMPQLVDDVSQLVNLYQSGTRAPVLVGHDWGGFIVSIYASLHGSSISRLVLLNTSHSGAFSRLLSKSIRQLCLSYYMFVFQMPWFAEFMICSERSFRLFAAPNNLSESDMLAHLYTFRNTEKLRGPVNYYRASMLWGASWWSRETSKKYSRTKCHTPTLMIWARGDAFLDVSLAAENASWFHDYTVKYLRDPKASHWLMSEHAQEMNEYLHEFIDY